MNRFIALFVLISVLLLPLSGQAAYGSAQPIESDNITMNAGSHADCMHGMKMANNSQASKKHDCCDPDSSDHHTVNNTPCSGTQCQCDHATAPLISGITTQSDVTSVTCSGSPLKTYLSVIHTGYPTDLYRPPIINS